MLGLGQELGLSLGVGAKPGAGAGVEAGFRAAFGISLGVGDLLHESCPCPSPAHRDGDDALVVVGHDFVGEGTWMGSSLGIPVGIQALEQDNAFLAGDSTEERERSSGRGLRAREAGNFGALLRVSSPCRPREARCWAAPCRRDAAAGAGQPPSP